MATSPEVKIKISGDPKGFDAAVKSVQGSLKRLGGDLSKVQQLSARAFSFAGLGGAASITGLVALAKNAANVADEMGKLAQATGVSVEELSTLGYAADLGGSNVDELAKGLRKLAQEAERGGPTVKSLGISLVDAAGRTKSTTTLFAELAEEFSRLPDGAQKTALAIKLFGEEVGPKLIPTLNQGAAGLKRMQEEAERLGLKLTDRAVAAAEEFNDNLTRLQGLVRGVGIEIGNGLVPQLARLSNEFLDAREAGLTFTEALVGIGLRSPFKSAAEQVKALTKEIDELRAAQAAIPSSPEEVGGFQVDAQIERLEKLRRYYEIQSKRARTDEELDQERSARKLLQTQTSLQSELGKLADLRRRKSADAAAEEIKGAERLRDALRNAWQTSIDGARVATAEAKKLLEAADTARREGADRADDRRSRSLPPEVVSQQAAAQAEQLRSQANTKAQEAIIQAYQGRLEAAQKLSQDAIDMANRADKLTERISDDNLAAGLLQKLGEIREDAIKAQAVIKNAEARLAEQTAQQQQAELVKVESRIKALKELIEQPVKIDADISEAESRIKGLRDQIDQLKDKVVTVTVNTVAAGGAAPAAPGFAGGGFTGHGGKFQPAGIVHAGEFVLRQEVVRQRGMRQWLERINRFGAAAARGYAGGGLVRQANGTPINLHLPDGSRFAMTAQTNVAAELQRSMRLAALQRGRRK